jgi:flagellar basal-body rod modification protein FlgD
MMTVSSVTGALMGGAGTTTPKTHKNTLDSSDFMALLLAELENQNPLEPMDNKDYMAQMAQMNSLQELQKMNQTLTQLNSSNSMSEAANLIGRKIEANLPDGSTASGLVSSVSLAGNSVVLQVGDKQVPLSAVVKVSVQEATANA